MVANVEGKKMKPEEIKRLVAKSENDAVEFKRARGGVPADFWPSYSSFANTDGGVIIPWCPRRRRQRQQVDCQESGALK